MGADDRRSDDRVARFERPFFAVADGIFDHLEWVDGARLKVFLLILRHTKHRPVWTGWTFPWIARELRLDERTVRAALYELAAESPIPPRGQLFGRTYIQVETGRGSAAYKSNRITLLNWIRTPRNTGAEALMDEDSSGNVENCVDGGTESGSTGPVNPGPQARIQPYRSERSRRLRKRGGV